jgi:hypothetical protein
MEIFKTSFPLAMKYDLESRIWKFGVHQSIDYLQMIQLDDESELDTFAWTAFFKDIIRVFEELIDIQKRYKLKMLSRPNLSAADTERIEVQLSWHRSLCRIGDLNRYKCLYVFESPSSQDWSEALVKYQAASGINADIGIIYRFFLAPLTYYIRIILPKSGDRPLPSKPRC